jgi:hypothetical protein
MSLFCSARPTGTVVHCVLLVAFPLFLEANQPVNISVYL